MRFDRECPSLGDAHVAVCMLVVSEFGLCITPQDYVSSLRRLLRFDGIDRVSISESILRFAGFRAFHYVFATPS